MVPSFDWRLVCKLMLLHLRSRAMLTLHARVDPALGVAVGWNHFVSPRKGNTLLFFQFQSHITDKKLANSLLRLAMSSSRLLSSIHWSRTGDMMSRRRSLSQVDSPSNVQRLQTLTVGSSLIAVPPWYQRLASRSIRRSRM